MSLIEAIRLFAVSSPNDMTPETAETILILFVDSIMQLTRLQGVAEGRK